MTLDDFIAWLGTQRDKGRWHISAFGNLRNVRDGQLRCPLQVLTGSRHLYGQVARETFGMSYRTFLMIVGAADNARSPYHRFARRRMLEALMIRE